MVARKTSTTSIHSPCPLVVKPKSSPYPQTLSSKMASTSPGIPSPMPHAVFQNGVHQTCSQLRNIKQAILEWSTTSQATCCCQHWTIYKKAALNPTDPHWVLAGSPLHDLLPADLAVIAEGSLLNKVFRSKKDYQTALKVGLNQWTKRNGLPSMPTWDISDLGHTLWQEHRKPSSKSLATSLNH